MVASHVCTADEQLMRVCVGGRGGRSRGGEVKWTRQQNSVF